MCLSCHTICLVVKSHKLYAMEPEDEWMGIWGVNARGSRVGSQELTGSVLDQLLRVPPAQPLGSILIQGGDMIALGRPYDSTERSWRVVRRTRVFTGLPHPIKRTWTINSTLKIHLESDTPKMQCFVVKYVYIFGLLQKKEILENDTTQCVTFLLTR